MRRSKAPSMVNKFKRFCSDSENYQDFLPDSYGSEPEDESYKWGSKDNPEGAEKEYLSKNKRVFNIVWRDVTSKKHKTWKGDGTLEVNLYMRKAVAKDETGKYLGCSTKFQIQDLQEDYQMLIGGKEIEIQNEIKDEEEIYELRKRQVRNRNWGEEEYITPEMRAEEEKKPKGGSRFKPLLVLRTPEIPKVKEPKRNFEEDGRANTTLYTQIRDNIPCGSKDIEYQWDSHNVALESRSAITLKSENKISRTATSFSNLNFEKDRTSSSAATYKSKHFICFIKPSELQHYLFQQLRDYYINYKTVELKSFDLICILRQICNHPSFIKHSTSNNELVQHLTAYLPHWTEMGPFDSGKLEFLQYFLQNSMEKLKNRIIIIANNTNTLNMIQGLCDFMHIACLRLNCKDSEETMAKILDKCSNSSEDNTTQVLLTKTIHNWKDSPAFLDLQQIIVFENIFVNMKEIHDLNLFNRVAVYYLVTSFSIEEFLILPSHQKNPYQVNYEELLNLFNMEDSFCYVHTKINCNCFESYKNNSGSCEDLEFFKSWQHLAYPFDDKFLKESDLKNSSGNLVTVFCKMDL